MLRAAFSRPLAAVSAAFRGQAPAAAVAVPAARALSNSASSSNPSKSPYKHGAHRSNAEELVVKFPVTKVHGTVALCDGGGGAMGHPIEYIQLNVVGGAGREGECKYCGLRYESDHH